MTDMKTLSNVFTTGIIISWAVQPETSWKK